MSRYHKTTMPRLGQVVHRVTTPFYKKRGFAQGRIVTDWEKIVGPHLAQFGRPERLTFPYKQRTGGTVHIAASGPGSMIFEHQSHVIVERINTYFGYQAIERLRFRVEYQKVAPHSPKKRPSPLTEEEEAWLMDQLGDREDSPLKAALEKLGRGILQDQKE